MIRKIALMTLCAGLALPVLADESATNHDHDHDHDHEHSAATTPSIELESIESKASYANGVRAAKTLQQLDIDVDLKAFNQAIDDVMNEAPLAMTEQEMREISRELSRKKRETALQERELSVSKNLVEAEAFLSENKAKDGVITTKSGLQYKIIKEGSGKSPTTSDRVVVHYAGTLLDGTKFDSSYDRGQPATFGVTQVIAGWTEVLQLMKTGTECEVYIHPDLGYGAAGNRSIPANSLLVFKVELIDIE